VHGVTVFELGGRAILLFLTIVGGVYITRVVTVPLFREVIAIAIAKKWRLTKKHKAGT
jgi:hypothetical protein